MGLFSRLFGENGKEEQMNEHELAGNQVQTASVSPDR